MKKLIIVTLIAACLSLCAAVWPQATTVEEVAITPPPPTVVATQPKIPEVPAVEEFIAPEGEKDKIPRSEAVHDIISESEPTPDLTETQVIADQEPAPDDAPTTPEVLPTPEPEPTPTPASSQTVNDPQPGDMVYVPGFGWLECQGPGEVIHDEDIYENGNKISVMG